MTRSVTRRQLLAAAAGAAGPDGPHLPAYTVRARVREALGPGQVFAATTVREPALSAASQAGLVNNLNDGLAWGLFPLYFAAGGLPVRSIGVLAAVYPAVWGLGQLFTGPLSDRWGRKWLIVAGMWAQGAAIATIAATSGFSTWLGSLTLLGWARRWSTRPSSAVIGDVAHPRWRASSVGVYRLWRDSGFAVGALLAGVVADAFSMDAAIWAVAALTVLSGIVVAVRKYETHTPSAPEPRSAR